MAIKSEGNVAAAGRRHRAAQRLLLNGSAAALLTCLPGLATAQTVPIEATTGAADRTNPDASNGGSGDIVVTARKQSERLLDVPQSVTALSGADLGKLNATQFRDFANTVPGLQFTTSGAGQTQVNIRGVTTGTSGSQTVGIYVDDVPYGASTSFAQAGQLALDQGLFDLDHVEVLRGPQGTLYGASALGGVIKYVPNAPDLNDFGGTGQAGVSSTRGGGTSYNGAAAVNVPLASDVAALRVGGYYSRDGGFVDNVALGDRDVDRSRVYGARLDLLVKPTDRLSIRLVGTGQNIRREGRGTVDYDFDRSPRFGDLQQNRLVPEPFDQEFRLASGTISYDFGGAELTSISSYQTVRSTLHLDYSALFVPLLGATAGIPLRSAEVTIDPRTDKFAQEVRLQSSGTRTLEWLVGGFYTHESSNSHQLIAGTNPNGTAFAVPILDIQLPAKYKEIAGFGNVTLNVTDMLSLTGGIRYAHNEQRFAQTGGGLLGGSTPTRRSDENVTTWLASAQYKFSQDANIYARYATGYRPGGPNAVSNDPATGQPLAQPTFGADRLKNYELGFKAQTADRKFAIDLAGYRIDWSDIQLVVTRNGLSLISNAAGGARIWGSELTLTARPTRDFVVTGAFGYTDAKLRAADADLGARKGERLPDVPKFTAAVSADYGLPDVGIKPRVGATVRFISDRETSFDASPNAPQYDLGDYVSVDLRTGVSLGSVEAQLFARNLFDERGQLSGDARLSLLGGPVQVAVLQPRTIGLSLSKRF
ncbi:Outer membrane receptor proteins, mostly Fe transport [Sphingomonas palmae]|uniref:Outer membrane receptor proteins, mostly Fe transport n=1 Tax=Sphingomonas palmae TaxID=1855283 RepID=A0A1H7M6J6_9SPHN|nr:TonB-dependent receptor [Sphingomonas palmae]SEL06375.1 Outer membrane receptor proteins, mostly Fe transport [Sphingomonas palmae]